MTPRNPETVDALAAEYVLGTLRGAARRRFERWRASEWHIARRVAAWEDRLMPLLYSLPPVKPSPQVWAAIERRIQRDRRPVRALAAAVALIALLAGGFFAWRASVAPQFEVVAAIAPADAAPVWHIELDRELTRLRAVTVGTPPGHAGRSLELWALPRGGAPVSLGLLPASGRLERALAAHQVAALRGSPQVAVSLEPIGGSPTGAPTGPVLFVAELPRSKTS
jgi:anti-sigma-K factor RskA